MKSHSNTIIFLHWLLVPMLFATLFMGNDIAELSNDLSIKVDRVVVHMTAGIAIGVLFAIRLIAKLISRKTVTTSKDNNLLTKAASIDHILLYVLVFGVVFSGIAMAMAVDMKTIIETGSTLPQELSELSIRNAHSVLTKALMLLIVIHIIAAIIHQFVLRDDAISKIWFSRSKQ